MSAKIEYKIYKWNGSKFVDSGINIENTPAANLNHNMSIIIDAKPGNPYGIAWGQKFRVVITPVGDYVSDGKTKEMELGAKQKDITLPANGEHQFGEWSPYTKQGNTMVSYKTCINCSAQVVRQYRLASENTITLDALIRQIFSRIKEAIYNLFVVNRN